MLFTSAEEKALEYALSALNREIDHYVELVYKLKRQGTKEMSLGFVERKLNKYKADYNELIEIKNRGYFRLPQKEDEQ